MVPLLQLLRAAVGASRQALAPRMRAAVHAVLACAQHRHVVCLLGGARILAGSPRFLQHATGVLCSGRWQVSLGWYASDQQQCGDST